MELENFGKSNIFFDFWIIIKKKDKFLNLNCTLTENDLNINKLFINNKKLNYIELEKLFYLINPKIINTVKFNKLLVNYLKDFDLTIKKFKLFYKISKEKDKEIYNKWLRKSLDNLKDIN